MGLAWSHIPALLPTQWTCMFPSADSFSWRGTGGWQPWSWPCGHTMVLGPGPAWEKHWHLTSVSGSISSQLPNVQRETLDNLRRQQDATKDIDSLDKTLQMGIKNQYIPTKREDRSHQWGSRCQMNSDSAETWKWEGRRHLELWACTLSARPVLLSCFTALLPSCPATPLQFCFPALSTTQTGICSLDLCSLPGAVCILIDFCPSLRWGNLFSIPLLDFLLPRGSSSTTLCCDLLRDEAGNIFLACLNNESKNQFVERLESNEHTN